MKHLKIENQKALFLRDTDWVAVTAMTKEDLLRIAKAAVYEDDFESDPYDQTLLPNPADRIIYQNIRGQLEELHSRRDAFKEQSRNMFKEAYNKYCQNKDD